MRLELTLLPDMIAVCRLAPGAPIPSWVPDRPFVSVTRTRAETSIACAEFAVPIDVRAERGWRVLEVAGPLTFDLVGILAAITQPLADAGVSVFALSTYDTDYVLVREESVDAAVSALAERGHVVTR